MEKPIINGKVTIVTGASAGIGEETARQLGKAGAKVVLAARRADRLEQLAAEIIADGGAAIAVPTDITDPNQITDLVQKTVSTYGRIDILVNAAGWGNYDWLDEISEENLRMQYAVNVIGLAELTRQVLPVMKTQRSGHIINLSSYGSKISVPPLTVYASTKYAVEGFTDGLRRELIPWGIHVSRVHPGGVTGTEFNQRAKQDGGIRYRSFPVGKVTRDRVAREIIRLVERPRRSVFIGIPYNIPVAIEKIFPEIIDWGSTLWVRRKLHQEQKDAGLNQTQPARYHGSYTLFKAAAIFWILSTLVRSARRGLRGVSAWFKGKY